MPVTDGQEEPEAEDAEEFMRRWDLIIARYEATYQKKKDRKVGSLQAGACSQMAAASPVHLVLEPRTGCVGPDQPARSCLTASLTVSRLVLYILMLHICTLQCSLLMCKLPARLPASCLRLQPAPQALPPP